MYAQHWGLDHDPLGETPSAGFFAGSSHEEAIARLQFAVEHHHRPAMLLGGPGSGKSTVLAELLRQLRADRIATAKVSLLGQTAESLLPILNFHLTSPTKRLSGRAAHWRRLSDHLTATAHQDQTTALLIDDVELGSPCAQTVVAQLCQWGDAHPGSLAIVLGANEAEVGAINPRLIDRCQLRTDLSPWSVFEADEYLQHALSQAKGERTGPVGVHEIFTEAAIETIWQLSQGTPRKVIQLARWAMVAAAGMGETEVTSDTVQSTATELGLIFLTPATDSTTVI